MQTVEEKAIQTYTKNLEYLSSKHPNVAQKLALLDVLIESGEYTNKYDLEYMGEYFDVKELQSSNYLYGSDSKKVSKELNKKVNFKKNSNLFEGFPLYYQYEKFNSLKDKDDSLSGIYPLMTYYIDNTSKDDEMKVIEKFIFIGLGLGIHTIEIDKKISANEYLFIEDDLELFKLSLFCTPYYELAADKRLYFSIADDDTHFINIFNIFLNETFFLNRYLKYSFFPSHSDVKIKLIQNVLSAQDFTTFPYKTFLYKHLQPLEFLNNGYNVLNLSQHFKQNKVFSTKPFIVIAAGPSLQKNLSWLKVNQDRFIIMAVSSTLKILYNNNIVPDIVTHLDGFDFALTLFEGFPVQDFLQNSTLILGPFTPTKVREHFSKEQCFFMEEDTFYNEGFNSVSGACVGSTSIFIATLLATSQIYLLGLDFSIDKESGRTHAEGHVTTSIIDLSQKESISNTISFRGNSFEVKGNFTQTVYTIPLFQVSLQTINNKLPAIKQNNQEIYNLNDGAYIQDTIAKKVIDIDTTQYLKQNKKELQRDIPSLLRNHSRDHLSNTDTYSMKIRLSNALHTKELIQNYKLHVSYESVDNYYYHLFGLISDISNNKERESNNLSSVYYMFFKYTLPLIMDFFNTKGLKKETKHIKKFDKILQKELSNIEEIYERSLEDFIEQKC